jgi:UDP-2,3-diacylglucosamine pyrophosphatase LpxH
MLIFISDLHFVDETAGKHNIPTGAFEGVFEDLKKYGGKPTEIKIIFLGDIFDINRTTYWLGVDEAERPWGDMNDKKKKVEQHANNVMDAILEKNRKTFDIFKRSMKNKFRFTVEPERTYIPGNHDRLCNIFPSLRKKVSENLGLLGNSEPFLHVYDDGDYGNRYGVLARHGHEYDVWNYEGTDNFSDDDYAQIPIGDLITTEIAARLPYTILKYVGGQLPPEQAEDLKRNLEDIENVRPYSALFDWMFYQVSENPQIKDKIETALKEIVDNFNNLQYLKRWYKRHDKWNVLTYDEADKLQAAIRMFKLLDLESAEGLMKIFTKIFGSPDGLPLDNSDSTLIEKATGFLTHKSEYRYCIMGHTHNPMQVPVRITSQGIEQMYLNTGTWRARHVKGLGGGFITLKNLTYTIIYSKEESENQEFETWTGSLKEVPDS